MKKKIISILVLFIFIIIAFGSKEGGVRANNNMEKYAIEYIEENNILNIGENILAYYDYTISLDGTECAILTNERIIYHNKNTYTKSIKIENIEKIEHRENFLDGDIIDIKAKNKTMLIKIAHLNDGEYFLKKIKEISEK